MDYDSVVKNGRIVDGSGLPSLIGDAGIKGGGIAELAGSAANGGAGSGGAVRRNGH